MPPLEKWNPRPAIEMFINDKQRKDFSNVIERKATLALYYKGIFQAATDKTKNMNIDIVNTKKLF